ncbi:MAG: hypothetical protein N4A33_07390 [Bacteriovoracaceae bacterium]|jgi:hypothetical protein|nr:hypothetical protein [Bacteriovoracaceae bacterium]
MKKSFVTLEECLSLWWNENSKSFKNLDSKNQRLMRGKSDRGKDLSVYFKYIDKDYIEIQKVKALK